MRQLKDVKILVGCIGVLTVIAVGTVLHAAQDVFLPLFIAWILSCVMAPGVRFLTKWHVPIWLTTLILMVALLSGMVWGMTILRQMLSVSPDKVVDYYQQLVVILKGISARFGITADFLVDFNWSTTIRSWLLALSGSLMTIVSKSVMVVVFLVFILIGSPYIEYKIFKAFPYKSGQVMNILESISTEILQFLLRMTFLSLLTGLCIWRGLEWVGLDFAPTWGALAFILNFIPTVGSIVASVPPILISIVQFYPQAGTAALGVPTEIIMTILVIVVVQVSIGNIIMPKMMGDGMNLSPVVILTSLLLWSWLWGPAGALLSMPIAAIIKIVCDNVGNLNMIGILMGSGKTIEKEIKSR